MGTCYAHMTIEVLWVGQKMKMPNNWPLGRPRARGKDNTGKDKQNRVEKLREVKNGRGFVISQSAQMVQYRMMSYSRIAVASCYSQSETTAIMILTTVYRQYNTESFLCLGVQWVKPLPC